MKKKILISTSTFPKGSGDIKTARFVYDLAMAMRDSYEVHVIAPHYPGALSVEKSDGLTIHRFRYFFPVSYESLSSGSGMLSDIRSNKLSLFQVPFFLFSQFFCTLRIVKLEKIDILNAHWIVPQGLIASLVKVFRKVTSVVTCHAADVFLLKRYGLPGKVIAGFIARMTDLFLPVSNFIKWEVINLAGHDIKAAVIPMGVNRKIFYPRPDKKTLRDKLSLNDITTFLFVGKLVEKKGAEVLLTASEILLKKGMKFNVVIAGGGIMEEELIKLSDSLGLNNAVKFLGWVSNDSLPEIYSASDCLVVPSIFDSKGETEGMPVVINEALSSGIPVIASRISGIPDVIKPGVNGWLVKSGDAYSLAEAMEGIILGSVNMGLFSKQALDSSRDLSYENIASRYKESIDEAIKGKGYSSGSAPNKCYETRLNFHDKISVAIASTREFYINYFREEYCGLFGTGNVNAACDIFVYIGIKPGEVSSDDISIKGLFKGLYPYECVIKNLNGDKTEVYFKGLRILDILKFEMAAVFLQAEILEPIIYYKALGKDIIMLHASGVFDSKGGYLFSAATGVGKTTLAFHLANKGFGFLGDDLLFLSSDGSIYSYPKRVHFFSYLRDKNPFLIIPVYISRKARFRHMARILLKYLTGKHFYLSTRVNIKDILPKVRIGEKVALNRILFLKNGDAGDNPARDNKSIYRDIISTCDTRLSLYENILKRDSSSMDDIFEKEIDIIEKASRKSGLASITVKDIVRDSDRIFNLIKGKE